MACDRVRTISLESIQSKLVAHHPRLATALNDILSAAKKSPSPILYAARYRYGQLIVDRGVFIPPCSSAVCPECQALKENCNFGPIPLAVILNNSVEVFVDHEHAAPEGRAESVDGIVRTATLRMLSDGDLLGTFETLDAMMGQRHGIPPWSVAAGARSIWVLSPLGDRRLSETLAEQAGCDIDWNRGDSHWRLVEQVAHRENWEVELLFIGNGFLERAAARSTGSQNLLSLIFETGWEQSRSLRNGTTFEASLRRWYLDGPAQSVAAEFGQMYLYATVCHIFSISRGDLPAHRPAGSARKQYGPFSQFERQLHEALKIIKKDTGGKSTDRKQATAHYPVVVQPDHIEPGTAGFYSFRCPSLPGLRLPKVNSYADLPLPIKRTVDAASGYETHELDHASVTYFAQAGRYDMHKPTSNFRWQEFLAHVESDAELFRPDRLYYDSPFLVAGLRLVRRAGAKATAAR